MLRTALKPGWLALLALVLVAASIMAWLGQWQLDRAHENGADRQRQQQQTRAVVPLDSVLQVRKPFPSSAGGGAVTADGTWDGARQLLVADRRVTTSGGGDTDGQHGFWVLTPLRRADGSAVPVVRGWVAGADDPAAAVSAVPTGTVHVTGTLMPSEPPDEHRTPGSGADLPAGQIDQVDVTQLIKAWPYPLVTGYVLLSAQDPAAAGVPTQLVQLQAGNSAMALQNVSYAIQWFLFAGFGAYIWWRVVREDHRGTLGRKRAPTADDAGPDPARTAAEPVGDDGAPTPAAGGIHP